MSNNQTPALANETKKKYHRFLQPGEPVQMHENRSLMSIDRLGPEKLYTIQKDLRKRILADCVCKRLQFRDAEKIYKDASEQVQLRHISTF